MTSENGARYSKSNAWLYRLGQDFMTGSSDIRHEQIWTGRQCQIKCVLCLSILTQPDCCSSDASRQPAYAVDIVRWPDTVGDSGPAVLWLLGTVFVAPRAAVCTLPANFGDLVQLVTEPQRVSPIQWTASRATQETS
jgi:hypothetical protein